MHISNNNIALASLLVNYQIISKWVAIMLSHNNELKLKVWHLISFGLNCASEKLWFGGPCNTSPYHSIPVSTGRSYPVSAGVELNGRGKGCSALTNPTLTWIWGHNLQLDHITNTWGHHPQEDERGCQTVIFTLCVKTQNTQSGNQRGIRGWAYVQTENWDRGLTSIHGITASPKGNVSL